ncbi:MAG: NAD(P)-dependent oxidoreductase [Pseudomonadota bacterium]
MNIAFLGTGLMGAPMVRNLVAAGHRVTAWNRTAAKAQGLGAAVADTPAAAAAGAEMVISMLTDGAAVAEVSDHVPGQALWVDMSSTKPSEARALAALRPFLDAPVSGGTAGAQAASLAIMVGGTQAHFDQAAPVLAALGRPVRVGPSGAGQLAKLANQAIVGITIGAVAEATLLLEAGGADVAAVRAALQGGFADSTILQLHGGRMTARDFTPGGPSAIQLKDMNNVLEAAEGLTLPLSQAIRDRYARYVHQLGGADQDHAGLFEELLDLQSPLTRA